MCEDNVPMPVHKKYKVSANKHEYFNAEFDNKEEACIAATELISNGFMSVSIHDTEADGVDIW